MTHSTGSVTVRAAFTDLARSKYGTLGFAGVIRTDAGLHPHFDLEAAPGYWKGDLVVLRSNGTVIHCRTSHTIDYVAHTVLIRMARACFDRPRWVRAQLSSCTGDLARGPYVDDGLSSSYESGRFTGRVHRS